MTFQHLSENPRDKARAWNVPLGVPGFRYADLNRVRRLEALDSAFRAGLRADDPALADALDAYRGGGPIPKLEEANLLMAVGPHLGRFVARLFHVEAEHAELCTRVKADQLLSQWKKTFVERRVFKDPPTSAEIEAMDQDVLESAYRAVVDTLQPDAALSADPERELAEVTAALQRAVGEKQEGADDQLATVITWTRALAFHPALARRRQRIASFHVPHKTDYADLVPRVHPRADLPEYFQGPPESRRYRDGFDLTDPRNSPRENLREAHYCLTCHERAKDSCSTGMHDKQGAVSPNPLGIPLAGCPLDEKISEMIRLYRDGHPIAALAVIMIDRDTWLPSGMDNRGVQPVSPR
jgi:hypothetical protein